ncbi:MAG TPA: carboxy-S-adenosyl-L-methionine synthase CmoA [Gammaproteobacteria bacterium]|nr:carboxy-S-adenosyl-L-methionine synthase CmoA [Xanthomonadales bacterium]MCB1594946.1 carboxy-S-adenosyl-L-methionine synthase CmoA [Xanthomonadales bacterium]HOP21662.1 carboxy-S-adenosyl-L-methionine synthase CmoA [Gammaproteobacteria bacterium]HPI95794.1 carboxy-S-adenosyl-L-methionine synthase CmoA [Gammaproteobacteria bacterium]HPQ87967.1 carboxy-S-adenosyl-L-methionine synthase CmoA [Gammaproteobacteria bacterium]
MQKTIQQNKDTLFEKQFESVKAFAFDEQVAEVFSDMIQRSVPGYETILKSIAMFAMKYSQENSNIYDLGCSLGAVSVTIAKAIEKKNYTIHAIDTSVSMIKRCQAIVNKENLDEQIVVHQDDILNHKIENASVIVSNFTLQFLPQNQRQKVIENIFSGLNNGGIFILSEKVSGCNATDDFMIDHYHAYKKINGYSNKEIQQKRQALKDVLVPDSEDEIFQRLSDVGFKSIFKWFQCFNFSSFIAIK